jgi:hypothetical protein
MEFHIILFDLDGVLLSSSGYHQALQKSVSLLGRMLGAPETELTLDQIAQFETLGITNEWDSVAICTSLILIHVWQFEPKARLASFTPQSPVITTEKPNFDKFLSSFTLDADLPGFSALNWLKENSFRLNRTQEAHLEEILSNCRDINRSLTLPIHQEIVLGSKRFSELYQRESRLETNSYLSQYDQKAISDLHKESFMQWLSHPNHYAGIMTNRPSLSPSDYLSAPEAELGIQTSGFYGIPYLGSGYLGWFATQQMNLPPYSLMKPNPVHALSVMRMSTGENVLTSLEKSAKLWSIGKTDSSWGMYDKAYVTVFEDSVKGLQSAKNAQERLSRSNINIDISLVGVSDHPIKIKALRKFTDKIISNINMADWDHC